MFTLFFLLTLPKINHLNRMNKEKFDKLISGRALPVKLMSPVEKKRLFELMTQYGATEHFARDRFFKEGFKSWEYIGIDNLKVEYLQSHPGEIAGCLRDTPSAQSLFDATMRRDQTVPGVFYQLLLMAHLTADFVGYMSDLGMLSSPTVIKSFTEDNWKAYERKGIKAIVEEFCEKGQD